MDYVGFCGRWLIAAVFLVAAGGKIHPAGFHAFVDAVRVMRIVPRSVVGPVSVAVVVCESCVAWLMVWEPASRLGAVMALTLLVGFSVAILIARVKGVNAVCRCFGPSGSTPLGPRHLARNAALGVVAACVVLDGGPTPVDPVAVMVGVGTGLLGAALVVGLESIVEVFGGARANDRGSWRNV